MIKSVAPDGVDPEDVEVKSVDWLKRNAGRVDIASARENESEAWERGKTHASTADVDIAPAKGAAAIRLPDGDPHATILVEAAGEDRGPWAGACDCQGWRYHDGPCAHLVTRAVRSVLRSGEVPVSVELFDELANAGGPKPDERTTDGGELSDVGGLENVDDQEDDQDERSSATVTGPEANDAPQPAPGSAYGEDVVDDPADPVDVDGAREQRPTTTSDPFAAKLAENVPERYVMELDGEPYVRIAGYAAIARQADLRLDYAPLTRASETDYQHAEYEAVVSDADGDVIARDLGTAHVDGEDMAGAEYQLDELALTRAYRRAIRLATGGGTTLERGGDA